MTREVQYLAMLAVSVLGCGSGGASHRSVQASATPTVTAAPSTPAPSPTVPAVGSIGWAVGTRTALDGTDTSVVLRSADGGLTWNGILEEVNVDLDGIAFFDATTGWAVGSDTILRTDDGGVTWQHQEDAVPPAARGPIPDFQPVHYRAPVFIDSLHGFIAGGGPFQITEFGGPSLVIVTEDGGATWSLAPINGASPALINAPLRSACATRAGIAIASGSGVIGDVVVLSADAGHTWTEVAARTSPCVGAVGCSGDRDLWIAGFDAGQAVLCRSTDGGVSWSSSPFTQRPLTPGVQDLAVIDDDTAWAAGFDVEGRGVGLYTDDGGASWSTHVLPLGAEDMRLAAVAVAATSAAHAVLVGQAFDAAGNQSPVSRRTIDGGVSWESGTLPDVSFVTDVVLK